MSTLASPVRSAGPLEHFAHGYNRVAVSKDSRFVATSDVDMNIVVRENGVIVFEWNFGSDNDKIRPTERVRGLTFSPRGDRLVIAAGSELIAIRTDRWVSEWVYEAPRSFGFLIISPIAVDVAHNGDIVAAFDNGTIVVWDAEGNKKHSFHDNDSPRWLRFVAGGEEVVGSDSFSLCRWNLNKPKKKLKIRLTDRVFAFDADEVGNAAATRSLQDIVIWDLHSREARCVIPVGVGVPVAALHPTRNLLAFSERNHVKIVDYKGECVQQRDLETTSALSMAFSPAGDELLVGCTEKGLFNIKLDSN
jgi:WD40 repeat protein